MVGIVFLFLGKGGGVRGCEGERGVLDSGVDFQRLDRKGRVWRGRARARFRICMDVGCGMC